MSGLSHRGCRGPHIGERLCDRIQVAGVAQRRVVDGYQETPGMPGNSGDFHGGESQRGGGGDSHRARPGGTLYVRVSSRRRGLVGRVRTARPDLGPVAAGGVGTRPRPAPGARAPRRIPAYTPPPAGPPDPPYRRPPPPAPRPPPPPGP